MPPLKTRKFHRAMNKARSRRFVGNTDSRYRLELPKAAGTVMSGQRQVKVVGQVYRLVNPADIPLVTASTITVENAGSAANAVYRPAVGGAL